MKILNKVLGVALIINLFVFINPSSVHAAGPAAINLSGISDYAILTKSGISTTGTTMIVGDIGVSPVSATYITGFALSLPAGSSFSTSPLVTGRVYAPGYADPTPSNITMAISNMQTAYTDGAGRTNPTAIELGAGNIGGLTLAPGLYKWSSGVTIPSDLTLSGSANDVWIFQIAQNLSVSSATNIVLSGGAQANNVFWVVAGQTTIGTTAIFNGNILDQTAIVLNTGARLNGRAFAQSAVTLDSNVVTSPSGGTAPPPAPVSNPVSTPASTQNNNSSYIPYSPYNPTTYSAPTNSPIIYSGGSYLPPLNADGTPVLATADGTYPVSYGENIKTITNNLQRGSTGNNVMFLQQFLIFQNRGPAAQALARVGATSNFGVLTKTALAEFQANVGISPSLGNFGPATRAFIYSNY